MELRGRSRVRAHARCGKQIYAPSSRLTCCPPIGLELPALSSGFHPPNSGRHRGILEIEFMYAVIERGGKQYRVSPGDVLRVEKLDTPEGGAVNLEPGSDGRGRSRACASAPRSWRARRSRPRSRPRAWRQDQAYSSFAVASIIARPRATASITPKSKSPRSNSRFPISPSPVRGRGWERGVRNYEVTTHGT